MANSSASQEEMSQAHYAGRGKPTYINKKSEDPYHIHESDADAPDYIASNPRYWEYR